MKKNPSVITVLNNKASELKSFTDKLDELNLQSSYYLLLLVGSLKKDKERMVKRLQDKLGEFEELDLREVILPDEDKSFANIDKLFAYIGETEKNILFRNGDCLAGEYTGFTYSAVRYATPQEKYLLKKIVGSEKFFAIDIQERENIDKTLQRYAQTAILFDEADSFFGKIINRLKKVKVNGHTFANKRPAAS